MTYILTYIHTYIHTYLHNDQPSHRISISWLKTLILMVYLCTSYRWSWELYRFINYRSTARDTILAERIDVCVRSFSRNFFCISYSSLVCLIKWNCTTTAFVVESPSLFHTAVYAYDATCSLLEEPHTNPNIPLKKMIPALSWQSDPLVASFVGVLCTELATIESESATTGSGSSFSVGCGVSMGFFTETTGHI